MGMARFNLYRYVRTPKGWRYCKVVYSANGKIKPNVVLVGGKEQPCSEGEFFFNFEGRWVSAGDNSVKAQEERTKKLARQQYEQTTGDEFPEEKKPKERGLKLSDAVDAFLAEVELKVAAKNRRPRTLAGSRQVLREFQAQSGVKYINEVEASTIAKHMAFCIQHSRTKSARTAFNKFVLILQLLKYHGCVPHVGLGKNTHPLGIKDAPRFTEAEVETYEPEELTKFFFACGPRETAIFQTFHRAGLRENELATLRRQDCNLDGDAPYLHVRERPEYDFVPKAYEFRKVNIDPDLTYLLRAWLKTHNNDLIFPTRRGKVDGHLLRLCERVAKRAGLDPNCFWLHKFRATYATHCLRKGMDLETLRCQLGHRDTESLRRYVRALQDEERAKKVAEVFADNRISEISRAHQTAIV